MATKTKEKKDRTRARIYRRKLNKIANSKLARCYFVGKHLIG